MTPHPVLDPAFDFCTSSIGGLVQPHLEEADPGTWFLVLDDGSAVLDFAAGEAIKLAHLILAACDDTTQEA